MLYWSTADMSIKDIGRHLLWYLLEGDDDDGTGVALIMNI